VENQFQGIKQNRQENLQELDRILHCSGVAGETKGNDWGASDSTGVTRSQGFQTVPQIAMAFAGERESECGGDPD